MRNFVVSRIPSVVAVSVLVAAQVAAMTCDELLLSLGIRPSEAQLLTDFDPTAVRPSHVHRLAPLVSDVLEIRLPNGNRYVVRFGTVNHDLSLEAFATAFFNAAPGVRTPAHRQLTEGETEGLLATLPASIRSAITTEAGERPIRRASVAAFFPMESGPRRDFGPGSSLYENLIAFAAAESAQAASVRGRRLLRTASSDWSEMSDAEKERTLGDLRAIGPPFTAWTRANFPTQLRDHIASGERRALLGLIDTAVRDIPAPVLRQLADHWALFAVLGIADFHGGNWLQSNGVVMAIDLAGRQRNGTEADPLAIRDRFYPLPPLYGHPVIDNAWIRRMSPEMVTYLRGLTAAQIREHAAGTPYRLTGTRLRHMLERRDELLRRRDRVSASESQ